MHMRARACMRFTCTCVFARGCERASECVCVCVRACSMHIHVYACACGYISHIPCAVAGTATPSFPSCPTTPQKSCPCMAALTTQAHMREPLVRRRLTSVLYTFEGKSGMGLAVAGRYRIGHIQATHWPPPPLW